MWKAIVVVAALVGCSKKASQSQPGSAEHSGGKVEAMLQLNKLGKNAKVAAATTGEFPKGKAGPTPATPCCAGPNGMCAVTHDWASSPVWSDLDFEIDQPNRFQYSYESDGKTFTATAVGNLDCHGKSLTYKAEGVLDENGNASVKLIEPSSSDN